MNDVFIIILVLVGLFYVLGKAADLVVINIRKVGERFGIKLFFLGFILGFFTSFPEFAVGISAFLNDVQAVSVGNLLGGIVVLFGLVLGIGAILNRGIKTEERLDEFIPLIMFFALPLIFGFDGTIGETAGLFIVGMYILLFYYFFRQNHITKEKHISFPSRGFVVTLTSIISGLVLVLIISSVIIRMTIPLLEEWHVPGFIIGALLFALGTNLPEIIVTLRSWRRGAKDLSVSNLFGSATANILILGLFSFLRPIHFVSGIEYWLILISFLILFGSMLSVFRTGNIITRKEGFVLLSVYCLFLVGQLSAIFLWTDR